MSSKDWQNIEALHSSNLIPITQILISKFKN